MQDVFLTTQAPNKTGNPNPNTNLSEGQFHDAVGPARALITALCELPCMHVGVSQSSHPVT